VLDLRPWDTDGEDLFEWYALIKGPEGGSYAGEHAERSIPDQLEQRAYRYSTAPQILPLHL
jgi:hypothetical protein